MNTYNVFDEKEPSCILFHAVAEDVFQVARLGREAGHDLTGLTVELERENVRAEFGTLKPSIKDAIVH